MNAAMDALRFAMRIRTVPLEGFEIPADVRHWDIKADGHDFTWILTYSTTPHITFRVQAFTCENGGEKKRKGQDATILGPMETAATFYKANTSFLMFDTDQVLGCSLQYMSFDLSDTNDAKVKWVTSHSRAIRHMSNWMRFLKGSGDSKRAADFFSVILEKELEHLQELASNSDHSEALNSIDLFERLLPRKDYLPADSLTASQRGAVRDYLQTAIKIRQKLSVFAPATAQDTQRDEKLLQQYP
jgi:hypothetical protein